MRPNLSIWLKHFEHHARWPFKVPDGPRDTLTAEDRDAIGASLALFQHAERSSGAASPARAAQFAAQHERPELLQITALTEAEKRGHDRQRVLPRA